MSLREFGFLKLNEARLEGLLPNIPIGERIPRILHQTYARRELPAPIQRNINRIRALNPGWTYMFYDDADCIAFIRDEYGQVVLDRYLKINKDYGAARADLFRYLLMYRYGGVYLDIKSGASWPLDEVLRDDDRYLLSHWKNRDDTAFNGWGIHPELSSMERGEFQQWFIIAVPGHPFLKSVIEHVLDNVDRYVPGIHRTGAHAVFRVTGPIAYSLAILPLLNKAPWRLIDAEDDIGLAYSIFSSIGAQENKTVFRAHYTDLENSLTEIGLEKRAVFAAYRSAARFYKALKNQRSPELGPPH